ncbi:MAG TPA: hypothetical protein VJB11_03070 [archaeon]|nr:hypothetical protein [archaeon]
MIEEIKNYLSEKGFVLEKENDEGNEYEFSLKEKTTKEKAVKILNDISYEIREMFDLMPVLHPRGDHDGNIVVLKYNEQDLVLTLFAETNNNKYQPT